MGDERAIFADNLRAAEAVATRLAGSLRRLCGKFPLDAQNLPRLSEHELTEIDAFLKRFENLQDIVEARLLRGVLLLEDEAVDALSARDIANRAEKLGAIDSAAQWRELKRLRNRLAHDYPTQPSLQAERLNQAKQAAPRLIAVYNHILGYVSHRRLVDTMDMGAVSP